MRVKGGFKGHRRHKKILEAVKGYRLTRSKLFRVAKQAYWHAGSYAFAGRKLRKRNIRRLWITRLNAGLRENGVTYSKFINDLQKTGIQLNRKVLAHLAMHQPKVLKEVIKISESK